MDENYFMEFDPNEAEIRALKNLLDQTDYQIIKSLESLLSANSITEFISVLKETFAEVSQIVENRKTWREKINVIELQQSTSESTNMGDGNNGSTGN